MSFRYTKELLDNALTYDQYRQSIAQVLGQSDPGEQLQKMIPYYAKNAELMDEFMDSYKVNNLMLEALRIARPVTWLVLTEGWCGDAAFINPMLRHIEQAAHGKVQLLFVLKDSHPELMDANLTNGGRSIPKLIVLNEQLEALASWGPRPEGLQTLMPRWKAEGLQLKEIIARVHEWYRNDDTRSTQQELRNLIYNYSDRANTAEELEALNLSHMINSI
jgi:hypothetical protein